MFLKVSNNAPLLCLKRCKPLLAPRFKVLSAFIEIVFPFLKSEYVFLYNIFSYNNNINYVLLLSKHCGVLLQNKKTKLT